MPITFPLKAGDSGPEVRTIQTRLRKSRVAPKLKVSGEYCKKTVEAVKEFQRSCPIVKLRAHGEVDNRTFWALERFAKSGGVEEPIDWPEALNEAYLTELFTLCRKLRDVRRLTEASTCGASRFRPIWERTAKRPMAALFERSSTLIKAHAAYEKARKAGDIATANTWAKTAEGSLRILRVRETLYTRGWDPLFRGIERSLDTLEQEARRKSPRSAASASDPDRFAKEREQVKKIEQVVKRLIG